jgi:hypothetical protein
LAFDKDRRTGEYSLQGESNLYPDDLHANCQAVCLAVPAIAAHRAALWALVERRNKIAHGKKIIINSLGDYQPYENAASDVMHELAYAIIEAISVQSFLKEEVEYAI